MAHSIRHRGPDDAGYAVFAFGGRRGNDILTYTATDGEFAPRNPGMKVFDAGHPVFKKNTFLAFGHRRLAVIDPGPGGHQPMFSSDGKIAVVYNGEIYNFRELKKILHKETSRRFESSSDTEVIIRSYERWGIECVKKFDGMFAFALWDGIKNEFYLVRDRYGIIPVYYYLSDGIFVFGSEIKSILNSNIIKARVDTGALIEYFTFQNIFTDRTLFDGIKILSPGNWLRIKLHKNCRLDSSLSSSYAVSDSVTKTRYWDYDFSSCYKKSGSYCGYETEGKLREIFVSSVKSQIVSDVPVGTYLSGGMDTGSIAAVARKYFERFLSFTVGFDLSSASGLELGFDERKASEELANLLKTEHYEAVLHAGDMEAVLPDLIWHIEEPRVGQSYPDYYAARLAGKFVKVVLSGTGGDELFGGYPWRYYRAMNASDKEDYYRRYYNFWQRLIPDEEKQHFFRRDIYKRVREISTFEIFKSIFRQDSDPVSNEDYINESMYFEAKTFLHGLFVVTNKISMAHSLETRVPFMANRLVDFAMHIPPRLKFRSINRLSGKVDENELSQKWKYFAKTKDGKTILRRAMRGILPPEVLFRSKQGFSAPDASWFRGESIEYIKDILLKRPGAAPSSYIYEYLDYGFVKKRIEAHISGKVNYRLFIWSCLSFEWWLRRFIA